MTLRDDLLPVVDSARQLITDLGLRRNGLKIVVRTWTGDPGADGSTFSETETEILPPPRIRDISSTDEVESAGKYAVQTLRCTRITPEYAAGGYSEAELRPSVVEGQELIARVSGPFAGDYAITSLNPWKNFGWDLVIERRRTTP